MRMSSFAALFVAGAVALPVLAQPENRPDRGGRQQPERGERPGQPGPGMRGFGQQLSAADAKVAWEAQAKGVAKRLKLTDEKATATVAAYSAARESHSAAFEKLRQEMQGEGGGGGIFRAMQDLNRSEGEKLEKALGAKLSSEETKKAMESLGTFNFGWDTMAFSIHGMKLEADKQQQALDAVETFVVASERLRANMMDGDRQEMMERTRENREKLSESLKKVLTEEQMRAFEEATRGRGQRQRPDPRIG